MTIDRTKSVSPAAFGIIGLIVIGLGAWIVLNSAFFDIRTIRVEGARSISEDDIRTIAAIRSGTNLIMLDTGEVAARLLGDPWIHQAFVERDLPTTAVIRVIERRPAGWVQGPSGFGILAGDGTILERTAVAPLRLPHAGSWPETLRAGERITGLESPLRVTASMQTGLLREIASVTYDGADVLLDLRSGGSVLYGPASELSAKNRALATMLRWAAGQNIVVKTVDVRVPGAPSLEPERGSKITSPIPSV